MEVVEEGWPAAVAVAVIVGSEVVEQLAMCPAEMTDTTLMDADETTQKTFGLLDFFPPFSSLSLSFFHPLHKPL